MILFLLPLLLNPNLDVFGPTTVTQAPAFLDVMPSRPVEMIPLHVLDVFGPKTVAEKPRLKVYVYKTKGCPPCRTLDLDKPRLDVEWCEGKDCPYPWKVDAYPTCSWQDKNGKWWRISNWQGPEWFCRVVAQTPSVVPRVIEEPKIATK